MAQIIQTIKNNSARVQVGDLRQGPAYEVTAQPVNVTGPSSRPDFTSAVQAKELADALSGLRPQIAQYFKEDQANELKSQEDAFKSAFGGMSIEDTHKYYQQNQQQFTGLFKAALDKQYGIRVALENQAELNKKIGSGELDVSDPTQVQAELGKMRQGFLGGEQPANHYTTSGYDDIMYRVSEDLKQKSSLAAGQKLMQEALDNATSIAYNSLSNLKDPSKAGDIIEGLKATHGQGTPFNLNNAKFNDIAMSVAERLANEGKSDLVKSILGSARKDLKTGQDIPSLIDTESYAKKSSALVAHATAVEEKKKNEAYEPLRLQALEAWNSGKDPKFSKEQLLDMFGAQGLMHGMNLKNSALERQEKKSLWDTVITWQMAADKGQLYTGDATEWLQKNKGVLEKIGGPEHAMSFIRRNEVAVERQRKELGKVEADADMKLKALQLVASNHHFSYAGDVVGASKDGTETASVTSKEAVQLGLQQLLAAIPEVIGPDGKPDQTATELRRIEVAAQKGVVPDQWAKQMSSGVSALSYLQMDKEGRIPPAFEAGYERYRLIKSINPKLASQGAGNGSDAIYENYERLLQDYNGDKVQAAKMLNHAIASRQDDDASLKFKRKELDNAISKLSLDGKSSDYAKGYVSRYATMALETGAPHDKAIEYGRARFEQDHVKVDGWPVFAGDIQPVIFNGGSADGKVIPGLTGAIIGPEQQLKFSKDALANVIINSAPADYAGSSVSDFGLARHGNNFVVTKNGVPVYENVKIGDRLFRDGQFDSSDIQTLLKEYSSFQLSNNDKKREREQRMKERIDSSFMN